MLLSEHDAKLESIQQRIDTLVSSIAEDIKRGVQFPDDGPHVKMLRYLEGEKEKLEARPKP